MAAFRDIPIKNKLTAVTMLTSGVALLLACLAFIAYEFVTFRGVMVSELSSTAAIVGDNMTGALAFNDPQSAEQTLRSLNLHRNITSAAVYREGALFASYVRDANAAGSVPERAKADGHEFRDDHLSLFRTIAIAGEPAGALYIQSDMRQLQARLWRYWLIGVLVLVASSLVAFLLSEKLQTAISRPIFDLAATMSRVRAENDYSIRASKQGEDELGSLIDGFNAMLDQIRAQDQALQDARSSLEQRVEERTRDLREEAAEREQAQAELERTHRQLLETSRQAGMAEVAVSVLHNVGNVLNSVNVSVTTVMEQVTQSRAQNLSKATALIQEHSADLGSYLTGDARGKRLPEYLVQLAGHLLVERDSMLKELEHLRSNVDHIKEIVSVQQSYATVSGLKESVDVAALIEDALRMNSTALQRHEVDIVRHFQAVPVITTEKHKVLQILVNLIRNAKFACTEARREGKRITIGISREGETIQVSVADNGVGIASENMTRIFAHGFTTRRDGHGFGLHSGALAARELGGSLRAFSEGVGCGAAFILELPITEPTAALPSVA
ncbi:HAMP domain-containing protein [Steroidobacter sp. S1-65]|uniref:histidine kinase n=1 Tax=Steroidobacter gossypii TaxID=2805490 RepID=A0ABS1WVE6_9GAMM|nr:CHASE sensor domain-containing protein [Steroidobacter gossypii]MBM0104940.1 HAMP domain-containing protein [Steroidobacter gossypii]